MATSVWTGHISFGLVSIPIKLAVAARRETISFNQLHKTDHSRVKQVLYCQAEDKPVERKDIVKGYEYEKDKYIVIDDEDLKQVQPKTAKIMEIVEFVKAKEVDPLYLESSYYVQPDEAGEKPYTLLFAAMQESGYSALARLTMHNREHLVMLRPGSKGLILHTLFYKDEIRGMNEFRTDTSKVSEGEMKMALNLLEAMAGAYEPEKFKDNYREQLNTMIEAKAKGKKLVEAPHAQELAPVIDIMDALKRSLSQMKRPPAREEETATGPAKKTTTKKSASRPQTKRAVG